MAEEQFVPMDFVYGGRRWSSTTKELFHSIHVINEDGALTERIFGHDKKWRRMAVGAVYRGATFTNGSARGLHTALTINACYSREKEIEWDALDQQAAHAHAAVKLENDAKKMSNLEEELEGIRKIYNSLARRGDYGGIRALEDAVLNTLRKKKPVD